MSKKSIKQIVREASFVKGGLSGSDKKITDSKHDKLMRLKDSLDELQASYGDLNALFNNTVAASDNTISSLLKDLRYTVARLSKADFELRYDTASESLFIDGEDAVAVNTKEVLSMLSSLVSLFPDKSITLKIDGDSDFSGDRALDKLTELSEEPSVVPPEEVSGKTSPEGDIDKVLTGVGDSKIQDDSLAPEDRFTCTYKREAYSIWDKQLKTLVKVVGTPKEADALLEGLVTGAATSQDSFKEPDFVEEPSEPTGQEVALEEPTGQEGALEEPLSTEGVSADSVKVMDSSPIITSWSDLSQYDISKLHALGYKGKQVREYIAKVTEGLIAPFFASVEGLDFLTDKDGFSLESDKAQKFLDDNLESLTKYCGSGLGIGGLTKEDLFLTAYTSRIREAFKI